MPFSSQLIRCLSFTLMVFNLNGIATLWPLLDQRPLSFSTDFIWGVALSEYQNSGALNCPHSTWAVWECAPKTAVVEESGAACDFMHLYESDISLIKQLGVRSLRISLEWSNIEPQQGEFDAKALARYRKICKKLRAANIIPMVTIHHFSDPQWFAALGGFEAEENIDYFVRFAKRVFSELAPYVPLWCTINEPTIYMLQGYIRGVYPPGKTVGGIGSLQTAVRVLENLLKAHVRTYQELKQMPYGDTASIGLVHQYLEFVSYSRWNPLEKIPSSFFTYLLNDSVIDFFNTGRYKVQFTPLLRLADYRTQKPLFDFIGLNYYSRVVLKGKLSFCEPVVSSCFDGEVMSDMPYALYPQGIYDALMRLNDCGVPLYVTEHGIPDQSDEKRPVYLKRYLAAIQQAIAEGADVRGYYHWSLMDNFEWDMGYTQHFGLFAVDRDTFERIARPSAFVYRDLIAQAMVSA